MPTISVTFADKTITVEHFRSRPGFESEWFEDYLIRVLPLHALPELSTTRCLISGFPVASIMGTELADMLRHAVGAMKFDSFNELTERPNLFQVQDAIESILDHLAIRVVQGYRPAPSLSYSNGQFAIARLSKGRQLAILLNQLLFDGGMYRDQYAGIEDVLFRNRSSARMADIIIESKFEDKDTHPLHELHAALVELDAKYRIGKLEWHGRKERERQIYFREHYLDSMKMIAELTQFVMELVTFRDEHEIGLETSPRWSQSVYRSNSFEAAARLDKSNLIETVKVRDYKTSPQGKKTPVSPEAKAKAAKQERIMASLDNLFAKFKIGE